MAPEPRTPYYSSKPTTILKHLTHPPHPLHLLFTPTEFLCAGCDALGSGARYRCEICDFNLHDVCGTCPSTVVTAPLHPNHPLFLINDPINYRFCHICGDRAKGLLYTCRACDFHVHPLCTQLPLQVQFPLHPHHLLKLQPAAPATCALCFKGCTSWRYHCDACRLDLHIECAFGAGPDEVLPVQSIQPPPPHEAAPFSGGGGSYGTYSMGSPEVMTTAAFDRQNSAETRKKIYLFVARVAANVVSAFTGVPLDFF